MKMAGIDTNLFQAHSVLTTVASIAKFKGAPIRTYYELVVGHLKTLNRLIIGLKILIRWIVIFSIFLGYTLFYSKK